MGTSKRNLRTRIWTSALVTAAVLGGLGAAPPAQAADENADTLFACPKTAADIPQVSKLKASPYVNAGASSPFWKETSREAAALLELARKPRPSAKPLTVCVECLASCVHVVTRAPGQSASLIEWAKTHTPGLNVGSNKLAYRRESFSDSSQKGGARAANASFKTQPLSKYQWYLKNDGDAQGTRLDVFTTVMIPGIPGEDVGAFRPNTPPENLVSTKKVRVAILDTGVDVDIRKSETDQDRVHPNLKGALIGGNSPAKAAECAALAKWTACANTKKPSDLAQCDDLVVDADKNGYPLDCYGWSLVDPPATRPFSEKFSKVIGNPDVLDDIGHGSHVAGIIGASANDTGIQGVLQNVEILAVKIVGDDINDPVRPQDDPSNPVNRDRATQPKEQKKVPPGPDEDSLKWNTTFVDVVARGLLYAIRNDAQVINMSLSWPAMADQNAPDASPLRQMIKLAEDLGILIVGAAGNDSTSIPVFPCSYEGVICVASHGPDGALSHFSNYGSAVDVAAPGLHILSTVPLAIWDEGDISFTEVRGYEIKNGTSMATPAVVGVLARLLNAGIPPDEAYARLVLGTRPHREPSADMGNPSMPKKFTRSGNVDLENSFKVEKQPLILPFEAASANAPNELMDKTLIRLAWNRKAPSEIPFSFTLKNFWADAPTVKLTAAIARTNFASTYSTLGTDRWDIQNWKSGVAKTLKTSLRINDERLDGRLLVEITASVPGRAPRTFSIPLDISVPISGKKPDADFQVFPLAGGLKLVPETPINSVLSQDGNTRQDYWVIKRTEKAFEGTLILEENTRPDGSAGQYRAAAAVKLDRPEPKADPKKPDEKPKPDATWMKGSIAKLIRLDTDLDNKDNYVMVLRRNPDSANGDAKGAIELHFFDQDLNYQYKLTHGQDRVRMSDKFQWLRIPTEKGAKLVPAWVANGYAPVLDEPKATRMDKLRRDQDTTALVADTFGSRLYFLPEDGGVRMSENLVYKDAKGASTTDGLDSYVVINSLNQTVEQRKKGEVPLLLAKTDINTLDITYKKAVARGKEIKDRKDAKDLVEIVVDKEDLELPSYRNFKGLFSNRVQALYPNWDDPGTLLVADTSDGTQRTAFIPADSNRVILDVIEAPLAKNADSVMRISGVYRGPTRAALFAETHYDIQYRDLGINQEFSTSLNHYSFIPTMADHATTTPVVLGDTRVRNQRLPGLLTPLGQGDAFSLEVIVPSYDNRGVLEGLSRPAKMRLTMNPEECMPLAQGIDADPKQPFRAVFFCGDRFVRIPLSY